MRFLDEEWMKGHVACVDQQGALGVVILNGKTLFENVAIGARLADSKVGRDSVEEACRAAFMHVFFRDLLLGWDLSNGQKRCLSMARAKLRIQLRWFLVRIFSLNFYILIVF
jgi:ATP-binding cassette, subfamily B (MDR/TAP), member 1